MSSNQTGQGTRKSHCGIVWPSCRPHLDSSSLLFPQEIDLLRYPTAHAPDSAPPGRWVIQGETLLLQASRFPPASVSSSGPSSFSERDQRLSRTDGNRVGSGSREPFPS